MKAVIVTKFGPPEVLQLQEVAKPTPKDNEILVRIRAANINFGDLLVRNFNKITPRSFSMPGILWIPTRLTIGLRKPKQPIPGSEFAGEVVAVGKAVRRFQVGDAVFGYRSISMGAHAEYLCVPENSLVAGKPVNMSDAEAASIPYGAITAMSLLRKVDLRPGQKVLVNGASGGIGSAAVQLAKHLGAEVTGVCGTPRVDFVRALGADHVIDYNRQDFTRNGETYDLIIDIQGKLPFSRCKHSLKPDGKLLYVSFKMKQLFQMFWTARRGGQKVICAMSSDRLDDLHQIKELAEAGVLKSIIDRCYPLEQAAEAHRYIEKGNKTGSVILTMASSPSGG